MTIKTLVPIITALFYISVAESQIVTDNFNDSNFTENPEWTGDVTEFVVNEVLQLQLNYTAEGLRPVYLSTSFNNIDLDEKEWRFDLKLDFSPSSANKVVIYLASNTSDLLDFNEEASTQEGYFLEIGENGSNDGVSLLYRNGINTTLIERVLQGQFANNFNTRLRVRRDAAGNWEIATAPIGSENYSATAMGNHSDYNSTQNLGFICYFSATRSNLFFFDNIYFGDYIFDTIPPRIIDFTILDESSFHLYFSEMLDSLSASILESYHLIPGNVKPSAVQVIGDSVTLNFSQPFQQGVEYSLRVESITDIEGNLMEPDTLSFLYFELEEASYRDIVINEFLSNTNPSQGLPEAEFIELYNRSNKFISLKDWSISDNTSSEGKFPDYVLAPKEYLILCPSSALLQYESFGPAIVPSSWQILNITGDSISLKNKDGKIIDDLKYTRDWYQNDDKRNGGYSLELINSVLPCYDPFIWIDSNSNIGGTPGSVNSVADSDFRGNSPAIQTFNFPEPNKIMLQFDKIMDLSSSQTTNYSLQPFINISEVYVDSTKKRQVELVLAQDLINDQAYELTISFIEDCNGNSSSNLTVNFTFDNVPPQIEDMIFLGDSILLVKFNEVLESNSATNLENYQFQPNINVSALEQSNQDEVIIFVGQALSLETSYTLKINAVEDIFGNAIDQEEFTFLFNGAQIPGFNQLLITEIMAKPAADQVLPNVQYFELFNPTSTVLSLYGLQYMDARDTVGFGINYISPNEYLIICPSSQANQMAEFGRVIGLSPWPNLNNAGDDLQLINSGNNLVHQVFYRDSWYKEDYKKNDGGWTLEMIDSRNPCEGFSNWTASRAQLKGTPGKLNSAQEDNPDLIGPEIVKAFAAVPTEVEVLFNETIQLPRLRIDQFTINPPVAINAVEAISSRAVKLTLEDALQLKQKYSITIDQLSDCVGNLVNTEKNSTSFGLVEEPMQNDVILNEVLYDPRQGGVDFIELYNRSEKYINLNNWVLKTRSAETLLFANENTVIAPKELLAITTQIESLQNQYPNSIKPENVRVGDLPNLPNGEGIVHISSENGALQELLEYSDEMHLPFLRTIEGVSLERISSEVETNEPSSWRSAASSSGFATPGALNSQLTEGNIGFGNVSANPRSFAHDAPGRNYTLINYEVNDVGNLANVKIFDAKGTLIKTLANNETLNSTGFFRWDGDDNSGRKVRTGYYIIYFELFSSTGNTRVLKERVAVGANF
jgi:hypothetical protein